MKTPIFVAALLVTVLSGCNCQPKTSQRDPKLEIVNSDGTERTAIDFGDVQVDSKSIAKLKIRNGGTAPLEITGLGSAAPFGLDTMAPQTLGVGADLEVLVTFTPTEADVVKMGTLTVGSNDPSKPSATVNLTGKGVTSVAKVSPTTLDFVEVYVGESKELVLTLVNQGSNTLEVLTAAKSMDAPSTISGDLSALVTSIPGGGSAKATVKFSPLAIADLQGSIDLTFTGNKPISIPLKGKGIQAQPRFCFKRDDTGVETCTDQTKVALDIPLGSFCDNRLYADAGAKTCTVANGGVSGKIYFRNEGNVPVAYSINYTALPPPGSRCNGASTGSDFIFGNFPLTADGGRPNSLMASTVSLPPNKTDPKPWETTPISLVYRATSRCPEDAADQATVAWTRQGDNRMPGTIYVTLTGRSKLPAADTVPLVLGTAASPVSIPTDSIFYGVNNKGDETLTVQSVELWEEFLLDGGFDAGGPNGGFFQPCDPMAAEGPCPRFRFTSLDGGGLTNFRPVAVPVQSAPNVPAASKLGTITFGPDCPDAGLCPAPNLEYTIYAVIKTDDPYKPVVTSKISGYHRPMGGP